MFRASTRLGEVRISAFDARVLVAMAELSRKPGIGIVIALCPFSSALGAVGIVLRNLVHSEPPMTDHWPPATLFSRPRRDSQFAQAFPRLQGFVGFGITLDHVAEFHHSIFLLAKFD